jgi:hypothetical protein
MNETAKAGRCIPAQDGMAAGLVLKVDLEAVILSQTAPAGGNAPARTAISKEAQR